MQCPKRFKFQPGRMARSLLPIIGILSFCLTIAIGHLDPGLSAHSTPMQKPQIFHHEAGRFTFVDQQGSPDKPITVWYYQPPNLPADAPIVFVMHGLERNASDYRDSWIPYAKQSNFLLIVPEFAKRDYPTNYQYNYGNMVDKQTGKLVPENQWTFSAIEHLFDYIKQTTNNRSARYWIFGHSAGGQFVQRMVLFKRDARIQQEIAANSGTYAMPDFQTKFPYGFKDTFMTPKSLKTAFEKNFILLLGDQDIKEDDSILNKAPEAMMQGKNRFERGLYFYNAVLHSHAAIQLQRKQEFHWQLKVVPGVGHDEAKMAAAAAKVLLKIQ